MRRIQLDWNNVFFSPLSLFDTLFVKVFNLSSCKLYNILCYRDILKITVQVYELIFELPYSPYSPKSPTQIQIYLVVCVMDG